MKQNWFERHINITVVLGFIGTYILGGLLSFFNNALVLLCIIPSVAVIIWAVKMKGHSMWWVFPSILVGLIVLVLDNKKDISIHKITKGELMRKGYKYYCQRCGIAYKELSFDSPEGQLNTRKCICGTSSFATLDEDKPTSCAIN